MPPSAFAQTEIYPTDDSGKLVSIDVAGGDLHARGSSICWKGSDACWKSLVRETVPAPTNQVNVHLDRCAPWKKR